MDLERAYVHHENIKHGHREREPTYTRKHKETHYKERVLNVGHGSFTPIIFSTTGVASPEAHRKHHKGLQN